MTIESAGNNDFVEWMKQNCLAHRHPLCAEKSCIVRISKVYDDAIHCYHNDSKPDRGDPQPDLVNATNLFTIPKDVHMFFVKTDGTVLSSYQPSFLKVIKLRDVDEGDQLKLDSPPAFLQVGHWTYPLIPGISPCMVTDYGAYLFPDVMAETEGSAVAVVLPEDFPSSKRQNFEDILKYYTIQASDKPAEVRTSETSITPKEEEVNPVAGGVGKTLTFISHCIGLATAIITWGIKTGVDVIVFLIRMVSSLLRAHIRPAENPVKVHQSVKQGAALAKGATSGAVKVTAYIVGKVGEGSLKLAKTVTPYLNEQGKEMMPKTLQSPSAKAAFSGAANVTRSTLTGVAKIYGSLADAAQFLIQNVDDETVQIVQHRYGDEMSAVAQDTVQSARNVSKAAFATKKLAMKRLLKGMAKSTGKAIVLETTSPEKGKSRDGDSASGASMAPQATTSSIINIDSQRFRNDLKKMQTVKLHRDGGQSDTVKKTSGGWENSNAEEQKKRDGDRER